MSLIPHGFFPRSQFDMDQWFKPPHLGPNTLDLFDPFDELDHTISRNLEWINKPEFLQSLLPVAPKVPQKYRITVDCSGYSPKSIKTELKDHVLTVSAREEDRHENDDFSVREFKKTYNLPKNAIFEQLVSFMTAQGQLVIEVPLRETELHMNMDLFPKIVDAENGSKAVSLNVRLPEKIDPSKVRVNIKDRDLIVIADDKIEKPDSISKFHYYKRTTLPENTEFDHLKCSYDNHQLSIWAPLDMDFKSHKLRMKVPVEYKHSAPAIQQAQHPIQKAL